MPPPTSCESRTPVPPSTYSGPPSAAPRERRAHPAPPASRERKSHMCPGASAGGNALYRRVHPASHITRVLGWVCGRGTAPATRDGVVLPPWTVVPARPIEACVGAGHDIRGQVHRPWHASYGGVGDLRAG